MVEKIVKINNFPIKLGQFLKLADVVSDGIEAKLLIASGKIKVNDEIETRRGKKLSPGDRVFVENIIFICS